MYGYQESPARKQPSARDLVKFLQNIQAPQEATLMTNLHPEIPDRNLALELVRVTEAAALASGRWVGRGMKNEGDGAAVDAMRKLINSVQMRGVVVIGEGEKTKLRCCSTVKTWEPVKAPRWISP